MEGYLEELKFSPQVGKDAYIPEKHLLAVRVLEEDGRTLFCGSDVAKALGYVRPNDAIAAHCRATVKRSTPISGKMQEINFISEGDVYRLITHSKLPAAEKFESWVFDEVIPSIRKTGGYIAGQETMGSIIPTSSLRA